MNEKQRVGLGAALLDRKHPNWWLVVDKDSLAIGVAVSTAAAVAAAVGMS